MALPGESAGLLLSARQAATNATQSARGQAARFNELLSAYRSQSQLTGFELYWQTIVESLSNRRMTVLDPKASGHKRLFLGGPDELRTGTLLRESDSDAVAPNGRAAARSNCAGSVAGRPGHARAPRRARTATLK